jgi:hypothetical protein
MLVDVTCVMADATSSYHATQSIESVMDARAVSKVRKYQARARELGRIFVPWVFSSLGGFHSRALQLIREMAGQMEDPWMREQFVPFWVSCFSVAAQRWADDSIARHWHYEEPGGFRGAGTRFFQLYARLMSSSDRRAVDPDTLA